MYMNLVANVQAKCTHQAQNHATGPERIPVEQTYIYIYIYVLLYVCIVRVKVCIYTRMEYRGFEAGNPRL